MTLIQLLIMNIYYRKYFYDRCSTDAFMTVVVQTPVNAKICGFNFHGGRIDYFNVLRSGDKEDRGSEFHH